MAISKQVDLIGALGSPPYVIKNGDDTKTEDGVVYVDVYGMGNYIYLSVAEAQAFVEELETALGAARSEPLIFDDSGFVGGDVFDDTVA